MNDLKIRKTGSDDFIVELNNKSFKVSVSDNYWKRLTNSKISKEELIEKSFEFLLQKEPASAILSEFDLEIINEYFSDFEEIFRVD